MISSSPGGFRDDIRTCGGATDGARARKGRRPMLDTATAVIRLSDLQDGQEAECFAALVKKVRGITTRDQPYVRCMFRDKRVSLEANLWYDHRLHNQALHWVEGIAYRLRVRGELKPKYGLQLDILDIRPAG